MIVPYLVALGSSALATPPVVRVVATDYAYQTAASVPSGLVTVRLVNHGKEVHFLRLARLPDGTSVSDFNAARIARTPFATKPVASPITVLPGDSAEVTFFLPVGRYVGLCMYPAANGTAHADLGMLTEIDADAPPVIGATEPAADATLTMTDYAFALSAPLKRGRSRLRIDNNGSMPHSAYILRIPPGSTAEREIALFRNAPYKDRPDRPLQGLYELAPAMHASVPIFLQRGSYVIVCRLAGRGWAARGPSDDLHLDHGMILPFAVE